MNVRGSGTATLSFNGAATIQGAGTLKLRDAGGDMQVSVEQIAGEKALGGGWVRYAGFAGTASLRGSALELVVSGGDVAIVASGRGSARLVGSWSSTDSDLALVAPQAGEASPEPLRLARREGSRRRR